MPGIVLTQVALFTRAWIEIKSAIYVAIIDYVALFTRAWIEMAKLSRIYLSTSVALFTRAWIEILLAKFDELAAESRPLHEGVD